MCDSVHSIVSSSTGAGREGELKLGFLRLAEPDGPKFEDVIERLRKDALSKHFGRSGAFFHENADLHIRQLDFKAILKAMTNDE